MLYQTSHLAVQELDLNQLDKLLYYYNDTVTMQYIPNALNEYTVKMLEERFSSVGSKKQNGLGVYPLIYKENSTTIGELGLYAVDNHPESIELGYIIHRDYWKKGLGTELLLGFIAYCEQSLPFTTIRARMYNTNKASEALCLSLGFECISKDLLEDTSYRLTFERKL